MAETGRTSLDSSGVEIPADWERALQEDYRRDDERWSSATQVRDAIIILIGGTLVFLWELLVFLIEPGIR